MIQTSTPKINALSFQARHAKIIDMENTKDGELVYIYEFSITVDTALALSYDLSTLNIKSKPRAPNKSMPSTLSSENLNHANYIKNTVGQPVAHLDTVGVAHTPAPTPGGTPTQEQAASLVNNSTLPGFGGSFMIQPSVAQLTAPNLNSTILSAVLNFDRLYRTFLISKAVANTVTAISSDSVSVNAFIDTRVADNFKSNASGNSKNISAMQKTGLFSPVPGIPVANFYTGAPVIKLVKPSVLSNTAPNLTSVVNNAYGYLDIISSSPNGKSFERGPGNTVKGVNYQTRLNNTKIGLPKGITNLDTQSAGSKGTNVFLPDFRSAAVRSIFDFGIAPSTLIPVNVDNTVVSIMQNFQGTSNLKNNGS